MGWKNRIFLGVYSLILLSFFLVLTLTFSTCSNLSYEKHKNNDSVLTPVHSADEHSLHGPAEAGRRIFAGNGKHRIKLCPECAAHR